ncbi:MAG: hypothetical protein FWH06_02830 [Oscillospiraceae bacterium]|nr:hypothetical protein [Oscillospiraceae bacterium]
MSIEAVKEIARAEEGVLARKAETAASCKRLLADAESRGRALLENALARAAGQESDILKGAAEEAEKEASAVLERAAAAAAAVEAEASGRLPSAVSFISERIVSA